ncbi:glycosyltransferase [Azovibrio restrictus]|uniref:glycosyltransferase n=1 Tax=Azovibrio restrictus TaxID=146938 RepID=UPI0026EEBD4D|nr:glycosyltransferase [Azovibrio restrictus]
MRILMISDVYFPRVNGVSTSIETFRTCLAQQGVEVTLVAPRYGSEQSSDGLIRLPSRSIPLDPEDRLMSYRAALELAPRLEQEGYDLVHIQTPFVAHYAGVALARRLGIPAVATYHTLFEEYLYHYIPFLPREWLRGLARRYSRRQCNELARVIVPSTAMAERLREYGVGTALEILPTGIPLERFAKGDRAAFRQRHGIAPDRPQALFVGRVAHEKNIDFLLEALQLACRRIPDLCLVVTGEGPARPALERRAEQLGLRNNVLFLGYLDRIRELPDAYAGSDLFVFASRTETQGLVLLEAMAAGLPVLGLAAMGTRDILEPERGCQVGADDIPRFASQMADLFETPTKRQRLAAEAPHYAAEWSDRAMAGRLATFYENVCRQHREQFHPGPSPLPRVLNSP